MMQKIRSAMAHANEELSLTGDIELDDAFVTAFDEEDSKDGVNKRGRGSKGKTKVFVAVEADKSDSRKGKIGKVMMLVTDRVDGKSVEHLDQILDNAKHLYTDGYSSYKRLRPNKHKPLVVPSAQADKLLPWVHTVIGNLKRILTGIYHRINTAYLQLYLDEFCYKFNLRYHKSPIFSLVNRVAASSWHQSG